MTRKAPSYANRPGLYPGGVLHTFEVIPWRAGVLWRLPYECPDCGHEHRHGGGDRDRPFMGDGLWFSDCPLAPDFAPMVRLVLPADWAP